MNYVVLSAWQVGLAALLIVINGLLSVFLRLGLERSLLVAAVRTVVQLLLVGLILHWVFGLEGWVAVVGLLAVMTLIAGFTAVQRAERPYPGIWLDTLVSIWASSWLATAYVLIVVIRLKGNWYQPQYSIPLLGMMLGNTLNGIALGQNTLANSLTAQRDRVEMLLSLGATRWEAARPFVQQAIRTGMTPMINSMMIVGVVSLPGMMTGQILGGVAPMDAVKYQIVIMFLISSATALGTAGVVLLGYRRLFNANHQFLYRLIQTRGKKNG